MSAFDTAMACTRDVIQCLNANHFTTPPYGPVPDAVSKLRRDANNLIDALVIAMDAEAKGVIMPPIPEPVEDEPVPDSAAHALHAEEATRLRDMPEPPAPRPLGEAPPPEEEQPDLVRRERERKEQEEAARHPQAEQQPADRERQERERREQEERTRSQQPHVPGRAPAMPGAPQEPTPPPSRTPDQNPEYQEWRHRYEQEQQERNRQEQEQAQRRASEQERQQRGPQNTLI